MIFDHLVSRSILASHVEHLNDMDQSNRVAVNNADTVGLLQ
jgi:hypothetical protein